MTYEIIADKTFTRAHDQFEAFIVKVKGRFRKRGYKIEDAEMSDDYYLDVDTSDSSEVDTPNKFSSTEDLKNYLTSLSAYFYVYPKDKPDVPKLPIAIRVRVSDHRLWKGIENTSEKLKEKQDSTERYLASQVPKLTEKFSTIASIVRFFVTINRKRYNTYSTALEYVDTQIDVLDEAIEQYRKTGKRNPKYR